jgi:hypothetical protein
MFYNSIVFLCISYHIEALNKILAFFFNGVIIRFGCIFLKNSIVLDIMIF